jgi:glycosyltransferase involved in cell wall biosynthesis
MPTFNSERFLKETIESVICQTYTNWELLITDDGSNDSTTAIINDFELKDIRIKHFKLEKNSGAAVARNNSIDKSKGQYIAFLDSDDIWLPQKLEIQLNLMEKNKSVFSHTSYSLFDEHGKSLNIRSVCNKWISFKDLVKYNWIGTSTVIYNVSVLGKNHMPDLRNRQDWALWINLIDKSDKALFIDEALTKYVVRLKSISSNKSKLIKFHWFIYRRILKLNVLKSLFYLIQNLYYHLMRVKYVKFQSNG